MILPREVRSPGRSVRIVLEELLGLVHEALARVTCLGFLTTSLVFVGVCFLSVCLNRVRVGDFTPAKHVGFEAAAWYWHFVDVVWVFLFVWVYWWGNG